MTYLYQCEKCKKTFASYEDAEKCERTHRTLDLYGSEQDLKAFVEYKEGSVIPNSFVVRTDRLTEWDDDQSKRVELPMIYARYVLKGVLNKSEYADVEQERANRVAEEERRNEDYWAERRSKRVAEEAEKKAAEEEAKRQEQAANAEAQDIKEALAI